MKHLRWIVGILLLITACTPDADAIPTLRQLPTLTNTPEPSAQVGTVESVFDNLPPTFTPTFTFTPSLTPTGTIEPTLDPTITVTPSQTITNTPLPTRTDIPTVDPARRGLLALVLTAAVSTPLPYDFVVPAYDGIIITLPPQPVSTQADGVPTGIPPLEAITSTPSTNVATTGTPATVCPISPTGGFSTAYVNNSNFPAQLGCPTTTAQDVPAAWQAFESGIMVWLNGEMLVFFNQGQYIVLQDTFVEGVDPQTSSETPPSGLFTPIRGFLKIWSNNQSVRTGLGWALNQEQGVTAKVQTFASGRMIWLPGRGDILVLFSNGTWVAVSGSY